MTPQKYISPLKAQFHKAGINDVDLCLYPLQNVQGDTSRPIFHYHLEKAGGLAITAAVAYAYNILQTYGNGQVGFARIDSNQMSDPAEYPQQHALINSPMATFISFVPRFEGTTFGVHELAPQRDWRLMTFLRDPFSRLRSFFYYFIRRGRENLEDSEAGFRRYVDEPQNFCYQCQMLSRIKYTGDNMEEVYQDALENLKTFDMFGTVAHIEATLLGLWTEYDLIPIVTERLHSNSAKTQQFEELRPYVSETHKWDYMLYEYAEKNARTLQPQIFEHTGAQGSLEVLTGLIRDKQADDYAQFESVVTKTDELIAALGQNWDCFSDLYDQFAQTKK